MKIDGFQGSSIVNVPELPGIYAWYYRPLALGNREVQTLGKLITSPSHVETEISMRYGLKWQVESDAEILYSTKRQPANEFLSEIILDGGDLINLFLQHPMVPHFAKPLYIGIHKKNLRERIQQHRDLLTQLWHSKSLVSQYLEAHPDATVEQVIKDLNSNSPGLDLKHSFALNARVKGVTPRDLVVYVYPTQNITQLRNLERVLHFLTDPICGRR